jgi:hypothetical protein
MRPMLTLAALSLDAAAPLLAQAPTERLHLRALDPAVREIAFTVTPGSTAHFTFTGGSCSGRDTLRLRVAPESPAVIEVPTGAFTLELRALPGAPPLHVELAPNTPGMPPRVHVSGPVVRAHREPRGTLGLGASSR